MKACDVFLISCHIYIQKYEYCSIVPFHIVLHEIEINIYTVLDSYNIVSFIILK